MGFNEDFFHASDGLAIFYYKRSSCKAPKGVVLIVHGMAEHAKRYEDFAKFLNSKELLVYVHDQRGHGKTGLESNSLGFLSAEKGWQRMVDDLFEFSSIIKQENPNLPIFLLGHSMGSVVSRTSIIQFPSLFKACILVGTTIGINKFMRKAGKIIANHEIKRNGVRTPSPKLSNLSFGQYNKQFKPNRTPFDWLSLNPLNVDAYVQDPLCGFTCTAGFYRDLFDGIDFASNLKNIQKIPKDFPILFLAGAEDPVGGNGKEVQFIKALTHKAQMTNVHLLLYPHLRHEILNEENKEIIYLDIYHFLSENL
ncbi:MAG: lysophospholipase [Eubacteriaceae bacterium]